MDLRLLSHHASTIMPWLSQLAPARAGPGPEGPTGAAGAAGEGGYVAPQRVRFAEHLELEQLRENEHLDYERRCTGMRAVEAVAASSAATRHNAVALQRPASSASSSTGCSEVAALTRLNCPVGSSEANSATRHSCCSSDDMPAPQPPESPGLQALRKELAAARSMLPSHKATAPVCPPVRPEASDATVARPASGSEGGGDVPLGLRNVSFQIVGGAASSEATSSTAAELRAEFAVGDFLRGTNSEAVRSRLRLVPRSLKEWALAVHGQRPAGPMPGEMPAP